jgi:hypothetical protein
VTCLARLFAVLHTAVKFDALHMLATLLSQKESVRTFSAQACESVSYASYLIFPLITDVLKLLHDSLRSMLTSIWESHIRVGITAILQNRVGMSGTYIDIVVLWSD